MRPDELDDGAVGRADRVEGGHDHDNGDRTAGGRVKRFTHGYPWAIGH